MAVGLVLGGGAPNLPLMSGALLALDHAGVEFDVVSTTGAGMLIGLMYAAPRHGTREDTLRATREMGVHDNIYNVFPVNYKIFHKAGPMAEAYTRFHQQWLSQLPRETSGQRFISDMTQFWMASFCPPDVSGKQNGLCQPPPWIDLIVDFDKLQSFEGEFLMSAYCIEDEDDVTFGKDDITAEHFKAALAMPLIYAPYKMNGKTYLEGSAFDTLAFDPGEVMSRNLIDTVIYFDVLGQRKLIQEPTSIYDAWVHSIINPLTRIAEMDSANYERIHEELGKLHPEKKIDVLRMPFRKHIPDAQWPKVLDWSYSNMSTLFDIGYATGAAFVATNRAILERSAEKRKKVLLGKMEEAGVVDKYLEIATGPQGQAPGWAHDFNFEEAFQELSPRKDKALFTAFEQAGEIFEVSPESAEKRRAAARK